MRVSGKLGRALLLLAVVAVLAVFALGQIVSDLRLGQDSAPTPSPAPAEVDALREYVLRRQTPAEVIKDVAMDAVDTKGQWAVVTMHPLTGVDEGVEGLLAIGRFEDGRWRFAVQGEELFVTWLELLPAELMTDDEKAWFR